MIHVIIETCHLNKHVLLTFSNRPDAANQIEQLGFGAGWFAETLYVGRSAPADWMDNESIICVLFSGFVTSIRTFCHEALFVQDAYGIQAQQRCFHQGPESKHFGISAQLLRVYAK